MFPSLSDDEKSALLQLARTALESAVQGGGPPEPGPNCSTERLLRPGASFVTLTRHGSLRGCIGALQAHQPLAQDVIEHAAAAGLEDFRFPPVQPDELAVIEIEVSVLTDPQPLSYTTPGELLAGLRPNIDGVILKSGLHRATFLPQVWEKVPEAELFLDLLCEKAGLPQRAWRRGNLEVLTYQVESFHEGAAAGRS